MIPRGLDVLLGNRLSEIPRLAALVEGFGTSHDLPARLVETLNLVLDEIVTNVVLYAFDDEQDHEIRVRLVLSDDTVTAEVIDDGRPFDPTLQPPPDLTLALDDRPIGGLGLHLARHLMDHIAYVREGACNRLQLSKCRHPDQTNPA